MGSQSEAARRAFRHRTTAGLTGACVLLACFAVVMTLWLWFDGGGTAGVAFHALLTALTLTLVISPVVLIIGGLGGLAWAWIAAGDDPRPGTEA